MFSNLRDYSYELNGMFPNSNLDYFMFYLKNWERKQIYKKNIILL